VTPAAQALGMPVPSPTGNHERMRDAKDFEG
jgi:hypothetical protein